MLNGATNFLRRSVRAVRKSGSYPLLLPHFRLDPRGLVALNREPTALDPTLAEALRLCDGTRTLAQVARQSGASRQAVLRHHDQNQLVLWRDSIPSEPPAVRDAQSIIVSPHPDDAAVCLGGLMLQQKPASAIVLDIFTQTAWSRFPAELNDVGEIRRVRWSEEWLVGRMAGATVEDVGLPEAILRDHMFDNVFSDAATPWDKEVAISLRGVIARLKAQHPRAMWYLPLCVGGHLDHRVVRDGALAALNEYNVARERIRFYEDLPYAATLKGELEFSACLPGAKLTPEVIDIEATAQWKTELCRVYWSQFSFGQITALTDYAKRIGQGKAIERLWKY